MNVVGATAHNVNADLDDEQDVIRVDHGYDAAALASAGRDVESQVLSPARSAGTPSHGCGSRATRPSCSADGVGWFTRAPW